MVLDSSDADVVKPSSCKSHGAWEENVNLAARPKSFMETAWLKHGPAFGNSTGHIPNFETADSMSDFAFASDYDDAAPSGIPTADPRGYQPSLIEPAFDDGLTALESRLDFDVTNNADSTKGAYNSSGKAIEHLFRPDTTQSNRVQSVGDATIDTVAHVNPASMASLIPVLRNVVSYSPRPEQEISVDSPLPLGAPTHIFKVEGNQANKLTRHKHWSEEEDEQLKVAVKREEFVGEKHDWKRIAKLYFGNTRTGSQCKVRWNNHLKPGIKRGRWLDHEDTIILFMVEQGKKWAEIASRLPGRIGENVRERYVNVLDPSLKKGPWTKDEDAILFEAHGRLGNKWSIIRKSLPGRAENSIKNRYHNRKNVYIRKMNHEQQVMEEAGLAMPTGFAEY